MDVIKKYINKNPKKKLYIPGSNQKQLIFDRFIEESAIYLEEDIQSNENILSIVSNFFDLLK